MLRRRLPRRELILPAECGSTHGIGIPERAARAPRPTRGLTSARRLPPAEGEGEHFPHAGEMPRTLM